ncbi:MAG: peptide chain release factor 1 [Cytophagales bacterium]|nr:peptide chain release factor 1 [Cytophagales bacterium]
MNTEKLEELKRRFEQVGDLLVLPETVADMQRFSKLSKEYKDLEVIVNLYDAHTKATTNLQGAKDLLSSEKDPEMREMAKMEIDELTEELEKLEEDLKEALIPKDPNDEKNVILEIRAGAGGDESSLFAGDLLRMYQRYCDKQGLRLSITEFVEGSAGGYNKIVASIEGDEVYGKLKFESGVHRVQRVPATESQGRVHTSAASVAVLPEAEEVDFELNMKDIKKDTYRASGAGGQHVNKTESAVRLTHLPTNTVVECQDGRSQHANYDKALKVLRSRLYEVEVRKQESEISAHRKSLVGSGDRSDKIRTYNWPQSRVTDHRINKTVYNLDKVVDGEIEDFIDALRIADNAEKMKEGEA